MSDTVIFNPETGEYQPVTTTLITPVISLDTNISDVVTPEQFAENDRKVLQKTKR